jgi:hypothetical protein
MFQINWKLKAVLYKLFEILKLKKSFYLIQKKITKRSLVNISEINKLWNFHYNSINKFNCNEILEIGAGKSLEQNIFLSYMLDNKINQTVIDITNMLDFDLLNEASKQIAKILNKKEKGIVRNTSDLFNFYKIKYIAPHGLDELIKNNKKFDICISTTALEHFKYDEILLFLNKLKNILVGKKLVSAVIDYSDHYSHTDKNISKLNYLSYTKKEWNKFNNFYLYQNRLRHQDYRSLFLKNNYNLETEVKGNIIEKPKKISNEFDINNNETFISWGYFLIKSI